MFQINYKDIFVNVIFFWFLNILGMKKKTPIHKHSVCSKAKRKSPSGVTAVPKQKCKYTS